MHRPGRWKAPVTRNASHGCAGHVGGCHVGSSSAGSRSWGTELGKPHPRPCLFFLRLHEAMGPAPGPLKPLSWVVQDVPSTPTLNPGRKGTPSPWMLPSKWWGTRGNTQNGQEEFSVIHNTTTSPLLVCLPKRCTKSWAPLEALEALLCRQASGRTHQVCGGSREKSLN